MKKIVCLLCLLCMVFTSTTVMDAAEENVPDEIVLMDNEYGTVTLLDTIDEDYFVGYQVLFENKTSNQHLWLRVDNGSVDGMMEYIDTQNAMVAPGMKTKAELRIYTDNSDVKSVDDLKNVKGTFSILGNDDGGSTYSNLLEGVDFSIPSDSQTENTQEAASEDMAGQYVLMDNEYGTVTLLDTIEDDYYVGYQVLFENKTADQHLWLRVDNGSVDGMMEYIDAQNAIVAPGMKTKAELRIYTDNSDVKSVDDLKNMKGTFSILGNNDGGSTYSTLTEGIEFEISDNAEKSDMAAFEVAASEETAAGEAVSENEIDEMLQGTWFIPSGTTGYFQFDNGVVTVVTDAPSSESAKEITPGETITTEDWEVTFTKEDLTAAIYPADMSGYYYFYEADEGNTFYEIEFDVKNLGTDVQSYSSAISNVVVHCGKYDYDNYDIYYDQGGNDVYSAGKGTTMGIMPLDSEHLYVGTSIPNEALDMGEFSAEVTIAGERYVIVGEKLSVQNGDSGDNVKKIQTRLIEGGYLSGTADGAFGSNTENAVISFQQDKGLDATGVVDQTTYDLLFPEEKVTDNTSDNEMKLSGSYKIDTENKTIKAEIIATDGVSRITIPYSYENGIFVIYTNGGDACIKEE